MKSILLAVILILYGSNLEAQVRSFYVLNPKVKQGDTVVIAVNPQGQGSLVCISALKKQYVPNTNGYVFVGIPVDAEPTGTKKQRSNYTASLVECGRGVSLDNIYQEFEVEKKNYSKTRTTGRGRSTRARKGSEVNAINKAFSASNLESDMTQGLAFSEPADSGDVIDPYGLIYKNNGKLTHNGPDFRLPIGTSIKAVNGGKVVLVARNFSKEGNMIIINHGRGIYSVYMHLSRIEIAQNQLVQRGQIIALSGDTGAGVREPHLHFSIKINGIYVDPLIFLDTVNQYLTR